MSLSAFKYGGDILAVKDQYDLNYFLNKKYKGVEGNMIAVTSGVEFSLPINATGPNDPMQVLDIFTYSNGVTFALEYRKYYQAATVGGTYFIEAWTNLKNKDGVVYRRISALSTSVTPGVGIDEEPWMECYYTPGFIEWNQNNPTIQNEEAYSITFDVCYYKDVNQLLDKPFFGTQKVSDFVTTWKEFGYTYGATNDTQLNNILNGNISAGDGSNPYSMETPQDPYDPSEPGGGDKPSYGPTGGDPIDFPGLPTVSAFTTGLLSAYNPGSAELVGLASELWSTTFVNSIEKLMNDPFDAIVGLSLFPFDIPNTGNSVPIKIGNYQAQQSAYKVTTQYVTIAGGSFTVPRAWNNFLDYTQTQVDIYIPFVGFLPLDIDDCMGKTLTLSYNIDMLSGAGVALLKCDTSVLYAKPVNVSVNIPLTGSSKAQLYTGLINVATTAVSGALVGGAAGAVVGGAAGAISTAATKSHSQVDRSGALSANTGVLGELSAYIVIHRPTQSLPKDFKAFTGYTSNITAPLAQCKGYTEVQYVHLTGIDGATEAELNEIDSLLKSGVII